jgi:hypothetical protein
MLSRVPGLQAARISDRELVILGADSEHYLGLDESGLAIWDQLEEPRTVSEIVDALVASFAADRQTIEKDVFVFIEKMLNEGVLQAHD